MKSILSSQKLISLLTVLFLLPLISTAQWSSRLNISPAATNAITNESMGSCIGVSGDTIHVVWTDKHSNTRARIWYRRSTDTGLTWNAAVALTDTNVFDLNPAIAVNGQNIHVVWRRISSNNIRSSYYKHSTDGGNTWGPTMMIDSAVADWPAVAVSGNTVYVANDYVVSAAPYNTEVFFLFSTDNGNTWNPHHQITHAVGRSEDESITAEGRNVFMSWNDNRSGLFQILYKHSGDYGVTWDSDVVVIPHTDYSTMVWADGNHVDVVAAGHPSNNHYQIKIVQSADTGFTWGNNQQITNDTLFTHFYPTMVRDDSDIHVTYLKAGVGAFYEHSNDGGITWDAPYNFQSGNGIGITPFVAYTGCALHIIYTDSGRLFYLRNPTGNSGHCATLPNQIISTSENKNVSVYPNPFTTETTIEISSSLKNENVMLKVFDVLGKEVYTSSFGNSNKIILARENLNDGIYFYRIIDKGKEISSGKLLIE